jgi:hypothetical protein
MAARSSSTKHSARGEHAPSPSSRRSARVLPLRRSSATLMAGTPVAFDEVANALTVRMGGVDVSARLDPSVSPIVLRGALERAETVVLVDNDGLVVVGALRTSPTPGVDKGDEYVIEAKRLELRGDHRVALVAGGAQVLLNAIGRIEIVARDITSRASRVHKLVGRMLHLN